MPPLKNTRRIAASAIAATGFVGFAARADAALTIGLRLPNGDTALFSAVPGEKHTLEIWATVSGSSTDLANSYGLSSVHGSIVSIGGLAINVAGKKGDVAQYKGGVKTTAVTPFAKSGEQPGNEVDLDGDGDSDLGAPNQNSAEGFFIARADPQEYYGAPAPGGTGIPTPDGKGVQWRIGRVEMTVAGDHGTFDIVFLPRRNAAGQIVPEAALWYDDEGGLSAKNGVTGTMVSVPFSFIPEPSTAGLLACAGVGVLRRRGRRATRSQSA
jgi:hypothetical protein